MLCYCDKCGNICERFEDELSKDCYCCGNSPLKIVPSEYIDNFRWRDGDGKHALIEEVIKKSPNFDQYLFEHRNEIIKLKNDDMDAIMAHGRAVLEGRDKGNRFNVKCPYCNATNVKKISGVSKGISVGLFGVFALGKISKQWHCNNCGSDF